MNFSGFTPVVFPLANVQASLLPLVLIFFKIAREFQNNSKF